MKTLSRALLAGIGIVAFAGTASAEDFPSQKLDVVLHASAGGGTDITLRQVMPGTEKALGQRIEVLSKRGGNGVVSLKYLEHAKPDGYTAFTLTASHLAAIISGKTSFTLDDLYCLARLTNDPQYFMAKTGKFSSAEDMIKDITSRPIKIGGDAVGGTDHLSVASFSSKMPESFDYTYVPFDGAPGTAAALVNGDIDLGVVNYSEAIPMIEGGRIEPVMVLADERQDVAPNVPTAKELGINSTYSSLRDIMTLTAVPEDRRKILSEAFYAGTQTEGFQKYLKEIGLSGKTVAASEACNAQLKVMYDDTAAAMKAIGLLN
ncbi:tripartite tricarboxylate transporter substrate-binding protein [uncultured Cohaesibacter sp.]|uniref:Bug family tripartite tricarboxylate transporter substrate binding protein n=1 Tax=uncultured Cohaesibacter sp. TaxID=1002546 RepID=UPI0029C9A08E|nr:tripartite tricarboxylate transporter substrate-binding protein [uncultured Cohaesibacter sp.]